MPGQKKTYYDQYTDYIKNNNVKPTSTSASAAKTATASTMKTNPNDDVSQIKGMYGAPNNSKIAVTPGGIPINYAMELTGKEQVGTSMGNNFDMSSVKDYGNPSKTDIVDRNMRKGGNNLLVDVGSFNIGGGGFSYTPVGKIGGFAPSQAYLDAMAYTQGLLDKLNTGRTSYSDKVDAMIDIKPRPENKILDEDKDAVVAALTATIDFHKETGKNAEIKSIEKIDE